MTIQSEAGPIERAAAPAAATRGGARARWADWLFALVIAEALVIAGLAWDVHYERTVWSQRAAYLHASLGKDKEDAGDLAGALPEYGAAVKLYPGNAKAWYVFGRTLRKGNPQLGLKELKRVLERYQEPFPRRGKADMMRDGSSQVKSSSRFGG